MLLFLPQLLYCFLSFVTIKAEPIQDPNKIKAEPIQDLYKTIERIEIDLKEIKNQIKGQNNIDTIQNEIIPADNTNSNTAKNIKVEEVLDNIKSTITLYKFDDIQTYYHSMIKTFTSFKRKNIQHLLYKGLFVITFVFLIGYIMPRMIMKRYANLAFAKPILYGICAIISWLSLMVFQLPSTFSKMLGILFPGVFIIHSLSHLVNCFKERYNPAPLINTILNRSVNISKACIYAIFSVWLGYLWCKLSANDPRLYQASMELSAYIIGIGVLVLIYAIKKPVDQFMQSNANKKQTFMLLWPWLSIALVVSLMFMIISQTKQFTFILKSLLTISLIPLYILVPRLIKQAILYLIKNDLMSKRKYLLIWYGRVKKLLLLITLFMQILICGVIWQINFNTYFISILTPALYYTLYYSLFLFICVSIAQFLTGYIALSYVNKIREPVRKLFAVFAYTLIYIISGMYFFSKILGINTAWAGASFGLFSAGIAFGIRDIINDVISGFFWVLDNSFSLGDTLIIDEMQGIIEEMSIFALKLRLDNGTLMTFRYSFIQKLGSKSKNYSYSIINIAIGYETDPEHAINLINQAYQDIHHSAIGSKILAPIEIKGVDKMNSAGLTIQARIQTAPKAELIVTRMMKLHVEKIFKQSNLHVVLL